MVSMSSKTIHLEPQMHDNYYVCFPSSRLEVLGVYTVVTKLNDENKWNISRIYGTT